MICISSKLASLLTAAAMISAALCYPLAKHALAVTTFTVVPTGMRQVSASSVAWGDYDGDGDLDLLITGAGLGGATINPKIHHNLGSGNWTEIDLPMTPVQSSAVAWGDYDADGDLDVLLTGFSPTRVSKIYRNDGVTFTDIATALEPVGSGSVAWADFENDGDLDFVLAGSAAGGPITRLYRNNGSGAFFMTQALEGVLFASVAWGDYDNDQDLDLVVTGLGVGSTNVANLYRNTNGTFADVAAGLTGVSESSVAWGDYDNDGDLDLLLTGNTSGGPVTRLYRNDAGTFTSIAAGLTAVRRSSVAWGDCDNDGDLDILLTGVDASIDFHSIVYRNDGAGVFTDLGAGLPGLANGSVGWADFDNDADLDLLLTGQDLMSAPQSLLYRNSGTPSNTAPYSPSGLSAVTAIQTVTLSWVPEGDEQTPAEGLTYNLRVGTTPGGSQVLPAMSLSNGYRRVVQLGNSNHSLTWRVELPSGEYYWSVQAVDGGFAGSPFALEEHFIVPGFSQQLELPVLGSSAAWGDYDSDGDLDLLLTGFNDLDILVSNVYRNDGNGAFLDVGAGLTGVRKSAAAWGDYDNDGDLDILLTGEMVGQFPISKLYRNEGDGAFAEIAAGLLGVSSSSVAWGDFDNDGDLDILLAGETFAAPGRSTKLYRNQDGVFTEYVVPGLVGVSHCAVAWGDYDNDGDLDILLAGDAGNNRVTRLYRNDAGDFTWILPSAFTGVYQCSVAWGDYDVDGDLDVLLTGNGGSFVYMNLGGSFQIHPGLLPHLFHSSSAWGDFDNDGDLDILLTGEDQFGTPYAKLYRYIQQGNSFIDSGVILPGVSEGTVAWGDHDNDGDLDILLAGGVATTMLFNNVGHPPNAPPSPPGNLASERNGDNVTFSWTTATDDLTPPPGLSYNLRVGTSLGGDQNVAAMATSSGYRKVVRLGNAQKRTSWTLRLPPGPYYWSVQAVDGAFAGSPFAAEQLPVDARSPEPTPAAFALRANLPNPFSATTWIGFELPHEAVVRVRVFDVNGRLVRTLADGRRLPAGRQAIEWDGLGSQGERVPGGVYFCLMEAGGIRSMRRMVLAR